MRYNTYSKRELQNYRRKIQRKAILRKRAVLSILGTCLMLFIVFSINSFNAVATENIPETNYKYFTYHEIEKGDTLSSLAEKYICYEFYDDFQDYIDEVKNINNLANDTIVAGQTIILPYFSPEYR